MTLFLFKLFLPVLNKYKKPIKNKVKTLLQQDPLLNETDLYETDDPILNETDLYETDDLAIKRLPQQSSQLFHDLNTLFSEIQNQNINDFLLSQDILTNITNPSSFSID